MDANMDTNMDVNPIQVAFPLPPPTNPPLIPSIYEATESHRKPIYSVSWCDDVYKNVYNSAPGNDQGGREEIVRYFATTAGAFASVYEVVECESEVITQGERQDNNGKGKRKVKGNSGKGNSGKNNSGKNNKGNTKGNGRKDYKINLIQTYRDPTIGEDFYCVAWGGRTSGFPFENDDLGSSDALPPRSCPMLALAGKGRKINLLNPSDCTIIATLLGHGDAINEIMFVGVGCTDFGGRGRGGVCVDEFMLLSASKDESIRLWNTRCGTCCCIFAGHYGHRDDVLSIDVHPLGHTIVTGGIDTTIKMWRFDNGTEDEEDDKENVNFVRKAIRESEEQMGLGYIPENTNDVGTSSSPSPSPMAPPNNNSTPRLFQTYNIQLPYYSTNKIHYDYVDCVRFVGDAVCSKSISNVIVMWKPVIGPSGRLGISSSTDSDGVIPLREFVLDECNLWFIRFNLSDDARFLAIGNNLGETRVWDVTGGGEGEDGGGDSDDDDNSGDSKEYLLQHKDAKTCVRMARFNRDGNLIATVSDGGRVFVYEFEQGREEGE